MKFNKNNFQILTLLFCALALMLTMISMLTEGSLVLYDNELTLKLAITLVTLTSVVYATLIIKRVNPKTYIYLSYSKKDEELAEKIAAELSCQFKKLSKYRFEIITEDSIPFGNYINLTVQENISKSDIVIVIVSAAYLQSQWCLNEFKMFSDQKKRIIPIVKESFSDLSELPKDISNIRALSLINYKSDENFSKLMSQLAKDLIKQRKD